MSDAHTEYSWVTPSPANGESGEGLADLLVKSVGEIVDVRRICDLGCGNGYLAGRLAGLGYEVLGVDASPSGVELGRQHYPQVNFVRESINRGLAETLNAGEFDLIVSSDVIEHLYRPSDLLEAAAALLKPKGHLLVSTPYHGYLKNLTLSITGRMDVHFTALWDGGHIKFFSVKTLSELLGRHGFTELHFSYYGRAPYLWKNMICRARKID
jgi:2-polyprenyl-3-methyl-5-hydroxy-6-metoxy-1,4-benzoquinol methylase